MTDFFHDLKRYGKTRAFTRQEHRDRVRDFELRQKQLAAIGFWFLAVFVVSGLLFFAVATICVFSTGERECRRMRACGRYWQCKRSVEVIGI